MLSSNASTLPTLFIALQHTLAHTQRIKITRSTSSSHQSDERLSSSVPFARDRCDGVADDVFLPPPPCSATPQMLKRRSGNRPRYAVRWSPLFSYKQMGYCSDRLSSSTDHSGSHLHVDKRCLVRSRSYTLLSQGQCKSRITMVKAHVDLFSTYLRLQD